MKIAGFIFLAISGLCLLTTYILQRGISKQERQDPDRFKLDEKKKKRITLGYYFTFAFLALAAIGGFLITRG